MAYNGNVWRHEERTQQYQEDQGKQKSMKYDWNK